MSGADLSDAEGRFESGVRMIRTSLDGADLSGVDLTNARITEEQLREASLWKAPPCPMVGSTTTGSKTKRAA